MSLIAWLPFTQDSRQQGLGSNVSVSGTISLDNSGKLGKCLNSSNEVIINTNYSFGKVWSFCFWGYVNGSSVTTNWTQIARINDGSSNLRIEVCPSSYSNGIYCYSTHNNAGYAITNGAITSPSGGYYNQWAHFCLTSNGTTITKYMNGVFVGTCAYNGSGTINGTFVLTNNHITKKNDARIYNHCLSPMEVKELAKGLVLHYPLNRQCWGQENLLKYTKVNATNQNLLKTNVTSSWNNLTLTTKDGYDCYLYPSAQSSTWFASGSWYSGMKANTTYTYTAWIYFTANANFTFTSLGHFQVYNSASTASDKAHEDVVSARIYQPSTIPANKWTKVRITFTTNNLANSYFVIYPRYNIAANTGDLYFRDCKLEESAIPTPWCPHSIDNEYSIMGLNSTTEYDCSGFCNNGTRTGTLTWTSDTPKYAVSTNFAAVGTIINNTSPIHLSNEFTIAWWGKINSWKKNWEGMFLLQNNANLNAGTNTYDIMSALHASTANSMSLTICQNGSSYAFDKYKWTYTIGVWAHYTCTYKAGVITIYQNGISIYTETITDNSSNDYYYRLGHRANFCDCQISDFRIYATALSASDVKSLYQNSAYIDSSGNVYGAVHTEV